MAAGLLRPSEEGRHGEADSEGGQLHLDASQQVDGVLGGEQGNAGSPVEKARIRCWGGRERYPGKEWKGGGGGVRRGGGGVGN